MKRTLTILAATVAALAMPQSAGADIVIAGLDVFDDTAAPTVSVLAADVTATAALTSFGSGEGGGNAGRGSSKDSTWGTFAGPAAASTSTNTSSDNVTIFNGGTSGSVLFTITNDSTELLSLNDVHFDAVAFRPNAARTWAVSVLAGSDISIGNVFTSTEDAITHLGGALLTDDSDPATHDQHDDINLSDFVTGGLASLADNILETGETAIIEIAFSDGEGTGSGHHLFVDNIAVSGDFSAVPEPASMSILGLVGLITATRRRKQ